MMRLLKCGEVSRGKQQRKCTSICVGSLTNTSPEISGGVGIKISEYATFNVEEEKSRVNINICG